MDLAVLAVDLAALGGGASDSDLLAGEELDGGGLTVCGEGFGDVDRAAGEEGSEAGGGVVGFAQSEGLADAGAVACGDVDPDLCDGVSGAFGAG